MDMQYITEYKKDWPSRFQEIAAYLREHLPKECVIHHVGSTSIPGMPAKDIIDLDIECPVGSMPTVIDALNSAGYEHQGDKGIPTREAFRPFPQSIAAESPVHHLYACESDSPELFKQLAFRDYLISHEQRANWLAAQKRFADKTASTRDQYIENKCDAYEVITRESIEWAKRSTTKR